MHEQHEMLLESVSPIGTEQWFCPACERRLLRLTWHPESKEIVVEVGNGQAVHVSYDEETLSFSIRNEKEGDTELTSKAEHGLRPWLEWLDTVDFDGWWDREL